MMAREKERESEMCICREVFLAAGLEESVECYTWSCEQQRSDNENGVLMAVRVVLEY